MTLARQQKLCIPSGGIWEIEFSPKDVPVVRDVADMLGVAKDDHFSGGRLNSLVTDTPPPCTVYQ